MASRSLNRVVLLGNLTRDPELKYTPAGTAVCTFGLATNRSWTTSDGTTKEEAQYHRIVAWQKLAELCQKLLTKGKKVYAEGRITYRDFTTSDGQQKSITEIVLDDFIVFHEGKRSDNEQKDKPTKNTTESTEKAVSDQQDFDDEPYVYSADGDTSDTKPKKSNVSPDDIAI